MSSEDPGRFFRAAPSGKKFTKSLSYNWTRRCDLVLAWVLVPLCLVSAGWTPGWRRRTRTITSDNETCVPFLGGGNLEFGHCLCVGWTNVGFSLAGYPLSVVCVSSLPALYITLHYSADYSADYTLHFTRCALRVARCGLRVARCTLHVARVTLRVSRVTCHVSRFTFHVSRVTCHVSRVTLHVSRYTTLLSFPFPLTFTLYFSPYALLVTLYS